MLNRTAFDKVFTYCFNTLLTIIGLKSRKKMIQDVYETGSRATHACKWKI